MPISELLSSAPCRHAVMALLHSLWQGATISAVLWASLRLLPARRPHLRYAMSLGGLLLLGLCIPATYALLARPGSSAPAAEAAQTAALAVASPEVAPMATAARSAAAAPERSAHLPDAAFSADWTKIAAVIWLLGFAGMLLRMVVHLRGAARLLRSAAAANGAVLLERLARCQEELGWHGRLRVLLADELCTPAVVGIIRPVLLLPASIASDLPLDYLDAILLHELAHLRRHDFLVNLGQMLLEAVLFFNPMAWWLSRQVRIEREACCDSLAAGAVGRPVCVAEALEAVVRSMQGLSQVAWGLPAPVVAAAGRDPASLVERVRRLLLPEYRPGLHLNAPALAASLVAGLLLIATTWQGTSAAVAAAAELLSPQERIQRIAALQESQADARRQSRASGAATVTGTLVTEDGAPPAGLRYISARVESSDGITGVTLSLENGVFSGGIPSGRVTLWASQAGFAPAVFGPVDVADKQDLRDVNLVLKRGFTARVALVDQAGNPVPAAKVTAAYGGPRGMSYGQQTLSSDKGGWLEIARVCELPMTLRVQQPGFQETSKTMTLVPDKPAEFRLAAAKILGGRVVAQKDGAPIAGARVVEMYLSGPEGNSSYHPRGESAPLLATSDAGGRFELASLRDDSLYNLCILADGYTPQLLYDISSASKALELSLVPTLHIRGKIVGTPQQLRQLLVGRDGKARIEYNETVMVAPHSGYGSAFSAPVQIKEGEATFDITGFIPGTKRLDLGELQPAVEATSDVNDLVIDLNRPEAAVAASGKLGKTRKVHITLVPPTGSPLPQGSIKVLSFKTIAANYLEPTQVPLKDGSAEFEAPVGKKISVECGAALAGYWFADSSEILIGDAGAPKEVKLAVSPAGAVHGTVLTAEGAPARGAYVSMASIGSSPARPSGFPTLQPVSCDDRGQFVLSPVALDGEYRLFASAQGSDAHVLGEAFKVTGAKPIVQCDLRFHPGVDVTVAVVSPGGDPVPGAGIEFHLQATPNHGASLSDRRTGGDGRATARQLDPAWPGSLGVTVQPARDYQAMATSVPFSAGPHRITLEKGYRFDGILLDASEKPVANIQVRFVASDYSPKYPWIYARTDAEGRFSASTLSPIAYKLYCDDCYPEGTTFTPKADGGYDVQQPAGDHPVVKIPVDTRGTFHVVVAPWAKKRG